MTAYQHDRERWKRYFEPCMHQKKKIAPEVAAKIASLNKPLK
jgi:hypothetical protein